MNTSKRGKFPSTKKSKPCGQTRTLSSQILSGLQTLSGVCAVARDGKASAATTNAATVGAAPGELKRFPPYRFLGGVRVFSCEVPSFGWTGGQGKRTGGLRQHTWSAYHLCPPAQQNPMEGSTVLLEPIRQFLEGRTFFKGKPS